MEKTIFDYATVLRRKIWPIALFVLLSCAVTYIVSQNLVKPVYEATSRLLINSSLKSADQIDYNDVNMNLSLVESYKEIIRSGGIVEQVVSEHPEYGLSERQLGKKLTVSSADKTQIISIRVEDGEYAKAAEMANTIAQTFIRSVPELMNLSNASVLRPADQTARPPAENAGVAMNLLISFFLATMVSVGAVIFRENVNDTIRSEKEAEFYVGLPVLAEVGPIRRGGSERAKTSGRKVGEKNYVTVE